MGSFYTLLDVVCIAVLGGWAYTVAKRKHRDEVGWAAMAALGFFIVGMAFEGIAKSQLGWTFGSAKAGAYVSGVLTAIIVNIVLHTRPPLEPPSAGAQQPAPDESASEEETDAEPAEKEEEERRGDEGDPLQFVERYWPLIIIVLMYGVTQLQVVTDELVRRGYEPPYPPWREAALPLLVGAQVWLLSHRIDVTALAGVVCLAYIPAINWMEWRWGRGSSYYSHGYLIPFVVWWLVHMNRERLARLEARGDFTFFGGSVLAFGLFLLLLGAYVRAGSLQAFSLVVVVCGLVFFLCGREVSRIVLFPLLFLFTMVPLPMQIVSRLTFALKNMATEASVHVVSFLRTMGLHDYIVIQDGSFVRWETAGNELDEIVIGDVCSGLRSLIALIAFGALFAYIARLSLARKLILFAAAVPIAMLANMWRIVTLTFIGCRWGSANAHGWVHDLTGYGIFAVAFVLFFAFERFLRVFEPKDVPPASRTTPQAA
jgi:exosortase